MSERLFAGIDIGGTKTAVALAMSNGEIISRHYFLTRPERGARNVVDEIIRALDAMIAEAGGNLAAIGIGCCGPLDIERGLILSPPNLPGWDSFPIVEYFQQNFAVPIALENDANSAALGEHRFGAGRGFENLVYMTVSTGIGGGIIINNRLIHGIGAGAGEFGHMTVTSDEINCGCGSQGCLEAICSGTSIARRARKLLAGGHSSLMSGLVNKKDEITAGILVEAARRGDYIANLIWKETIHYLAVGISSIAVMIAPEAFIIGGGVSSAGEKMFFAPLRQAVYQRVKMLPAEQIKILAAELKNESGIYGALALAFDAVRKS